MNGVSHVPVERAILLKPNTSLLRDEVVKRIKFEALKPGDIILTASGAKLGKAIRLSTRGAVSHAMICVQRGSIIDSTSDGVQVRNLQRELFEDDEEIFVFRLKEELPTHMIAQVVDFVRSEVGTRYSKAEAARSVLRGPRPRNKRGVPRQRSIDR